MRRPLFATAPAERHARVLLGAGVLAAHGLVMALVLQGGGAGDPRRLPPRASDQPALVYVQTPLLEDATPSRPLRPSGPATPAAAVAARSERGSAVGPVAPGPAAPTLLLALATPTASAPAAPTGPAPTAAARGAEPAATIAPVLQAAAPTAPRPLPGNALPAYPEAAREDGLQGSVQLQLQIDAQGRVVAAHWLRRSGILLLDLAARDALLAWRFEPARQGGEAVAGSLVLNLRFALDAPVSASTLAQR